METAKTYLTFLVCFIEATVLGGSIFGWPSLVYVFQQDKLYYHLCNEPQYGNITGNTSLDYVLQNNYSLFSDNGQTIKVPTCLNQKVRMTDAYTLASIAYGLTGFPLGIFFDRFGLRTTRVILVILGFLSYLQLALASPGYDWLIMTGAIGMGITCYGMVMTSCHVALLSKSSPSTITGIFMAGVDTSFALTVVKMVYECGVPKLYGLLFLACFWFLVLFSTCFLLPPFKVRISDVDKKAGSTEIAKIPNGLGPKTLETTAIGIKEKTIQITQLICKKLKVLFAPSFIIFNFWYASQVVRICMMTNSFDAWMTEIVDRDQEKVSFFTNVLAYFNFLEAIPCFLTGFVTDMIMNSVGSKPGGKSLALLPAAVLAVVISICYTVPVYFQTEVAIYVTIIFFDLAKPILVTAGHSYLSLMFTPEIFGLMYGSAYSFSGFAVFLMYPYFIWIENSGSFNPVNTLILATLILSFTHPLKMAYDWWHLQRTAEKLPLLPEEKSQ